MHWLMKSDSILNTILKWIVLLSIYQTNMSILTLDWIQATLVSFKVKISLFIFYSWATTKRRR